MKQLAFGETMTFADYFKLNVPVDKVLASFGYTYEAKACVLPRTNRPLPTLAFFHDHLMASLPHIDLTSETGRREFLIGPILMACIPTTGGRIDPTTPLK